MRGVGHAKRWMENRATSKRFQPHSVLALQLMVDQREPSSRKDQRSKQRGAIPSIEILSTDEAPPALSDGSREIFWRPRRPRRAVVIAATIAGLIVAILLSQHARSTAQHPIQNVSSTAQHPIPNGLSTTTGQDHTATTPLSDLATVITSLDTRDPADRAELPALTGIQLWIDADFAASNGSSIYRLNPADRAVTRLTPTQSGSNYAVARAGALGLDLVAAGQKPSIHIAQNGTVSTSQAPYQDPISADGDSTWFLDPATGPRPAALRRINDVGTATAELSVPDALNVSLGVGSRFVLESGDGRSFALDPAAKSPRPLDGHVLTLAAKASAYVTYLCDDSATCDIRYKSDATPDAVLERPGMPPRKGITEWYLSPDGTLVVHVPPQDEPSGDGPAQATVLDPVTGTKVSLGVPSRVNLSATAVAWSADQAWLFLPRDDGIAAWRPGLDKPVIIQLLSNIGPVKIRTFAFALGG
jgi:hypothetical protein